MKNKPFILSVLFCVLFVFTNHVHAQFAPTNISGCTLWLDASQLSGYSNNDPVTNWPDLSGNGNHATSTDIYPPYYTNSAINDMPCVEFSQTGHAQPMGRIFITNTATLGMQNSDYEIFFVFRNHNPSVGAALFSGATAHYQVWVSAGVAPLHIMFDPINNWTHVIPQASSVTSDTSAHVVSARVESDIGYLITDLTNSWTGLSGCESPDNTLVHLGTRYNGGEDWFDGDLAEFIIYDHALTSGERNTVETYLDQKWVNPPPPSQGLLIKIL